MVEADNDDNPMQSTSTMHGAFVVGLQVRTNLRFVVIN